MKIYFSIFILLLTYNTTFSQTKEQAVDHSQLNQAQPTIMVIPFVKEGEDMRHVLEGEGAGPLRIAIAGVKSELEKQGIQTINFRAYLKQVNNQKAMTADQQSSLKQKIITLSAADIYIETETQIIETPRGTSVTVILTAYDAFTGLSLVNKFGHSKKFYTENYEKLTEKALSTFLKDFTINLLEVFQERQKKGRIIAVDIGVVEKSQIDMDSEIGDKGQLLSELIENWFEENAHQSYFHLQGVTATKMIFNEVRIPPRKSTTQKNYSISNFIAPLRKYLLSMGLEVTRDIQGTKVFLTIDGKH